MGEFKSTATSFTFNRSIRFDGRAHRLTSDAGACLLRELDERLGFTRDLAERLEDGRAEGRSRHEVAELLRTRLYLIAQGYQAQSDADVLRDDAALRLAVASRRGLSAIEDGSLPSQPTLSRFQRVLAAEGNLEALSDAVLDLCARSIVAEGGYREPRLTIDVDSTPIDSHGIYTGSAYNGHYRQRCFHPLVAFLGETDHILAARLRPGNVHTRDGAVDFLLPLIERVEDKIGAVGWVRGDAGFPEEELLHSLEEREIDYVFRLRDNPVLDRMAEPLVRRPRGRRPAQPREWVYNLSYGAKTWSKKRRVVLVVQERPDDLYLHHFFLVTSRSGRSARFVLEHYRERGTMEGHLGELKDVIDPCLSSTTRRRERTEELDAEVLRANAASLMCSCLAYNLVHALRRLAGRQLSIHGEGLARLDRVRRLALGVAGRLVLKARRATLLVSRSTARIWQAIWRRIEALHTVVLPP